MPPISAGTPSQSRSRKLITTRTSGNSMSRSERAMSRKHFSSTAPGRTLILRARLRLAPGAASAGFMATSSTTSS